MVDLKKYSYRPIDGVDEERFLDLDDGNSGEKQTPTMNYSHLYCCLNVIGIAIVLLLGVALGYKLHPTIASKGLTSADTSSLGICKILQSNNV